MVASEFLRPNGQFVSEERQQTRTKTPSGHLTVGRDPLSSPVSSLWSLRKQTLSVFCWRRKVRSRCHAALERVYFTASC